MEKEIELLPHISAVMPVRNGMRFLKRSRTVIDQALMSGDELVVIDDGSTDGTHHFLKLWEKENSQVRVIKKRSSGLIDALSLGIKETKHSWFARLDVDDVYPHEKFLKQKKMIRGSVGAIFSDYEFIDQNNNVIGMLPSPIESHATSISLVNGLRTPHPSALVCKDVYFSVGGYRNDDYLVEDLSLWLRMTRESQLISVPEVLLSYTLHGNSVSVMKRAEMQKNKKNILKSIGILKSDIDYCFEFPSNLFDLYTKTDFANQRKITFMHDLFSLYKHGFLSRSFSIKNLNSLRKEVFKIEIVEGIYKLVMEQKARTLVRNLKS
jgi:glycosyltransferase involved in cell wall biosynthesis